MAATVLVWESANLFAGDNTTNNSKHLTLQSVMLPVMREKTAEHHAGGSIGAITIGGLGIEPFDITFKLVGSDPQTQALFGIGATATQAYTIYGAIRDKSDGTVKERKAIVRGRISELSESDFERGRLTEQTHKVTEVLHYELYYDKQEIYYFDYLTSTWRVNGIDRTSEVNNILRI